MSTDKSIETFEQYFPLIKAAVGWNAETFARRVGVSRQTINNLENKRVKLTKVLYNSIRWELDSEIQNNKEGTEMLKVLLDALIDNPDDLEKYPPEVKEQLIKKAEFLVPGIKNKEDNRKKVSKEWIAIVTALCIVPATIAGTIALGAWRKKK